MTNDETTKTSSFRRWLPLLAAGVFVGGLVLAFPPFGCCLTILFFLAPFVAWAAGAPRWRPFLATAFGASWLGWFLVLIWLRHIYPPWGWLALALLSGAVGMFPFLWLVAVRWAAPRIKGTTSWRALAAVMGLGGWWIVLDWVRTWLFTGFPWLPLAAAFWRWPMFLQLLPWTGHWGVTFLIVLVNISVAGSLLRPRPWLEFQGWMRLWKFFKHPDLYVFILPTLLLPFGVFILGSNSLLQTIQTPPLHHEFVTVGIVQPWTPADLKWNPDDLVKNWNTLRDLTLTFRGSTVDLVVWPEAAPPFPVAGPGTVEAGQVMQQLVDALGKPLLFGATAEVKPAPNSSQYDGIFVAQPSHGIATAFYAKRHLVPFGEYVPLRDWLPFLGKVVPIGDTVPGTTEEPLTVPLADGRTLRAAALVCYEDVFPNLARNEIKAGADFIVVLTNDAWYGEEGGALQHAAHSVLLAIETRRPVLRCGNDGWSGSISELGFAEEMDQQADGKIGPNNALFLQPSGTTYFRGAGEMGFSIDHAYAGTETFYVRYGDWFVAVSALLTLASLASLRMGRRTL